MSYEFDALVAKLDQITEQMEALGIVYRTGEFREGKPVWDLTELGRAVKVEDDGALPALQRMEKLGMVRRTDGEPAWELTELYRQRRNQMNDRMSTPHPIRDFDADELQLLIIGLRDVVVPEPDLERVQDRLLAQLEQELAHRYGEYVEDGD